MRLAVGVVTVLLLIPTGVAVAGISTDAVDTTTVRGPAIPLPGQVEHQRLTNINDVADSYGGSPAQHVFTMYVDGERYLVATDSEPRPGEATVSGLMIRPSETEGTSLGLIFADSVSVSQSGPMLTAAEYNDTREQYVGEVVHIRGTQRQLTGVQELPGVVEQTTFGRVSEANGFGFPLVVGPGRTARTMTTEVARDENTSQFSQAFFRTSLTTNTTTTFPGGYGRPNWWVNAPATITVLVVPEGLATNPYNLGEYLIDVDVHDGREVSPETIANRGDELAGEIVTVRGQAVGSRISTQETLLSVAKCAPDSVTIPATPPLCIPVPFDVAIHSGAIATQQAPTTVVPYAGLSSEHQDVPVTAEQGQYKLTGRVVSASSLDPRLDGYGLLVYERERTGELDAAGFVATLEERAENYTNVYQTQLAMSDSEYEKMRAEQEATPTASSARPESSSPTSTTTSDGGTEQRRTETADNVPVSTRTATPARSSGLPNRLYDPRPLLRQLDNPSLVGFLAANRLTTLFIPPWLAIIGVLGGGIGLLTTRRNLLDRSSIGVSTREAYAFSVVAAAGITGLAALILGYPAGVIASGIGIFSGAVLFGGIAAIERL